MGGLPPAVGEVAAAATLLGLGVVGLAVTEEGDVPCFDFGLGEAARVRGGTGEAVRLPAGVPPRLPAGVLDLLGEGLIPIRAKAAEVASAGDVAVWTDEGLVGLTMFGTLPLPLVTTFVVTGGLPPIRFPP
jgi:hypothetical protein